MWICSLPAPAGLTPKPTPLYLATHAVGSVLLCRIVNALATYTADRVWVAGFSVDMMHIHFESILDMHKIDGVDSSVCIVKHAPCVFVYVSGLADRWP